MNNAALKIESSYLGHQHLDVLVAPEYRANWGRDLARRKSGGRHLIKQRLEGVMILAIDQGDRRRLARQSLRRVQAAKTGSDNHYPRRWLAVHPVTL